MAKANVILWDIEATNLNGNFGRCLCIGYKRLGESKTHLISVTDFMENGRVPYSDKEVVRAASKVLGGADAWVTWYGSRFDVPFVNTRLLAHGLPPMPRVPHVDGWRIARNHLKLHSNRLQSVLDFLGHGDKTPLTPQIWDRASAGHIPSIRYIERHCKVDVIQLQNAYNSIKCLATDHPNIALIEGKKEACPICASTRVQKRGWRFAGASKKRQYFCRNCNAWRYGKAEKIDVTGAR